MPRMKTRDKSSWIYIIPAVLATCLILFILGFIFYGNGKEDGKKPAAPVVREKETKAQGPDKAHESIYKARIEETPDINYGDLEKSRELKELMGERKADFRIKDSLDMIVKADEAFKVGGVKISMDKILEKARIKKGEVYEENIKKSGEAVPADNRRYGIYVVQPGDNIWNIHFDIIKEYYESKGIAVEPLADEPDRKGFSSGIGKILKFSEKMVIIYNLHKDRIDTHIDIIQPLSKIVVYNMTEIFALLNEINYDNVDKIQFDGKNIWIATNKSENN